MYLDLPSNMLGSFLMGWFGVIFKADIRHVSDHLAVGLSTGYLGSLTTFSGWNQKMLDLASKGHWVFAMGGIILGMLIVNESIRVGVESAEGLHKCLSYRCSQSLSRIESWRLNSFRRHMVALTSMLLLWISLWCLSGVLAVKKEDNLTDGAILWLGCLFGPAGVWARWYLARLNGQGLGRRGLLEWLTEQSGGHKAMHNPCKWSPVWVPWLSEHCSTFVAEVYAMRESGHRGRVLAYILATFLPSFAMGTLLYSVPVWIKNYK